MKIHVNVRNTSNQSPLIMLCCLLVQVMDSKSPDKWLCRRQNKPSDVGWVPPSYLVPDKADELIDSRRTQEVFREDILKIKDEKQEGIMKRR